MKNFLAYGALALSLVASPALAEPADVMAPGGAGGGYDAMARLPFQAMREAGIFTEGAQFTNRGGAGGTIGLAEFVNKSKGNDNAVMSMGAILVGGILINKSPLSLDQTVPLARLISDTGAIAVPPDSPIKTPQDVIAELKKNQGAFAIGGGSVGGVDHIAAALITKAAGAEPVKMNYIPYPSGADVVTNLAGAKIKIGISGISEFKPLADAGRIRIIAVTGDKRLPGVDAPTLKESGVNVVISNWRGIIGAPGMSDAGKKMWLDRFAKMHDTPAWKKILETQGWEDAYLAGDDFTAFLKEETARQGAVLKEVGLAQ